ncbi:MAG: TetR/AcrR family transcriptional regulator [Solirubrobacterales bacterium]
MPPEQQRTRRSRIPQAKRRAEVIDAALIEFGKRGFDGTTTSMIAERADIQQPYIYALFENKRHLFLSCQKALYERMLETFRSAVVETDSPYERLRKMGLSYMGLLEDEAWVRCHLQVLAASSHPELQDQILQGFVETFRAVEEMTGAEAKEVARFFATGTLLNAMMGMGAPDEMLEHMRIPPENGS